MTVSDNVTAFAGDALLASGAIFDVALAVKAALAADSSRSILAFDDRTGRQVDFDLRGTDAEIAARLQPPVEPAEAGKRGAGRPKLGVVAREVTLLPRHWEWLSGQPGGASVALRKLVDAARNDGTAGAPGARDAQQAADRFMLAMLGNQPGYEEATRALYARDGEGFERLSEVWPQDLRNHARRLAAPAFARA